MHFGRHREVLSKKHCRSWLMHSGFFGCAICSVLSSFFPFWQWPTILMVVVRRLAAVATLLLESWPTFSEFAAVLSGVYFHEVNVPREEVHCASTDKVSIEDTQSNRPFTQPMSEQPSSLQWVMRAAAPMLAEALPHLTIYALNTCSWFPLTAAASLPTLLR